MTLEDMFDTVVEGLHSQGKKSKHLYTCQCFYRHPEELLKCGAGWLIPDHKYDPNMDKNGGIFGMGFNVRYELGFSNEEVDFIRRLQSSHDTATCDNNLAWTDVWKVRGIATLLENVGMDYDIDTSIVEKCWPKNNG